MIRTENNGHMRGLVTTFLLSRLTVQISSERERFSPLHWIVDFMIGNVGPATVVHWFSPHINLTGSVLVLTSQTFLRKDLRVLRVKKVAEDDS